MSNPVGVQGSVLFDEHELPRVVKLDRAVSGPLVRGLLDAQVHDGELRGFSQDYNTRPTLKACPVPHDCSQAHQRELVCRAEPLKFSD